MDVKITHVGIILDGNGRWAKKRLLPRNYGHRQGAKNVEHICEVAYNRGIKYLTVYAFSTENWKRDDEEVNELMKLLLKYLLDYREKAMANNIKVKIIGDKTRFNSEIISAIDQVEQLTKDNTGLNFQIAINYGGRDEITRSVKKIIKAGYSEDEISESLISENLDTRGIPDPDLIIRTSGELRISNFLIWQMAYSELYFTEVFWPDFDEDELDKALDYYSKRNRRYGGV